MTRRTSTRTIRRLGAVVLVGLLGLIPGLVGVGIARAAGGNTYYVNGTTGSDPTTAGACQATPFKTIGAALACVANDTTTPSSPDAIKVAAGTYNEWNLSINADVSIVGMEGATTIDAGENGRVLTINSPYTVALSGLTITAGLASSSSVSGEAGGIYNDGTLLMSNSTLSGNVACRSCDESWGGAIFNDVDGTLSVSNSTLSGNIACDSCHAASGGAIFSVGTLSISNSMLSDNTACKTGGIPCDTGGQGGAIYGGTGSISNSRLIGNSACSGSYCIAGLGGAISNFGTMSITNSTFSENSGCSAGFCNFGWGGAILNNGKLSLTSSTLGGKTSSAGNVACSFCAGQGGAIDDFSGDPLFCRSRSGCGMTLTNDTITYNAANGASPSSGAGGGIFDAYGTPTLQNDTIKHNTPDNCAPNGSVTGCTG